MLQAPVALLVAIMKKFCKAETKSVIEKEEKMANTFFRNLLISVAFLTTANTVKPAACTIKLFKTVIYGFL